MSRSRRPAVVRWLLSVRSNVYVSAILAHVARLLVSGAHGLAGLLTRVIRKNGVDIALPSGGTMRLVRDGDVELSSVLYWGGLDGYEPQTSATLRRLFQRAETFVDIGANVGFYSVLAGLTNRGLTVWSFEPVPSFHLVLERNIEANRLRHRVHPFCLAISDASSTRQFYLPHESAPDIADNAGTLVPDGWQAADPATSILVVNTVSLDEFEAARPLRVDCVKIDVEDHEAAVLRGMTRIVRRDKPLIVCEVLPRAHGNRATQGIVDELGYAIYAITAVGLVRTSRFSFSRRFRDFLLAPVPAPDEILQDADILWTQRRRAQSLA